jgi:hypothetical protein
MLPFRYMTGFELFLMLSVGFYLYLAPAITAWLRCRRQAVEIAVVNVFLGWTLLGWVGCLA